MQAKRGIPPEDQVPPEYREVERWAYQEHYAGSIPPPQVLVHAVAGAMGHAGYGLWQPADLFADEEWYAPEGWAPRPEAIRAARESALGYLAGLGLRDDLPERVLWALKRWAQGYHIDPRVLGLAEQFLALAPPYDGAILRGLTLPVGSDGWPVLTCYDPRAFAAEDRPSPLAGRPAGVEVGRAFRVPRPKAFSGGRPFAGNVFEVLEPPHSGCSIRGFSLFWAQDEVLLPRGVRLIPTRIERSVNPDGRQCAIIYLRQVSIP
ncbi:MAG: hypothetical protein HYU66_21270 [Armatimonadetes bacterium]|nr:hypothetical protein [Armatimonadota bacterium]